MYEREVFHNRNQEEQEPIDAYATVLPNLDKSCNARLSYQRPHYFRSSQQ